MDRTIDGWMDGWMDRWIDGLDCTLVTLVCWLSCFGKSSWILWCVNNGLKKDISFSFLRGVNKCSGSYLDPSIFPSVSKHRVCYPAQRARWLAPACIISCSGFVNIQEQIDSTCSASTLPLYIQTCTQFAFKNVWSWFDCRCHSCLIGKVGQGKHTIKLSCSL